MVQWRIVKNLLEEIREITGCDFLIFDRKNSVLLQTGLLTAEKLPQAFFTSEEQIFAVSLARKLFAVIAIPGMLTPEMIGAMKQAVIAYYDKGLEPICF